MHQAACRTADANSCLSINSMAINTLSALQYLKVYLSQMEVELTTRTCIVTTYAAFKPQKHRRTREFKCHEFGPGIREGKDTNLSTLM